MQIRAEWGSPPALVFIGKGSSLRGRSLPDMRGLLWPAPPSKAECRLKSAPCVPPLQLDLEEGNGRGRKCLCAKGNMGGRGGRGRSRQSRGGRGRGEGDAAAYRGKGRLEWKREEGLERNGRGRGREEVSPQPFPLRPAGPPHPLATFGRRGGAACVRRGDRGRVHKSRFSPRRVTSLPRPRLAPFLAGAASGVLNWLEGEPYMDWW